MEFNFTDEISPGEIADLSDQAIRGEADTERIIKLIRQIVFKLRSNEGPSMFEKQFLHTAFVRFLGGNMSLDRAFGLKARKGSPKGRSEDVHILVAEDILRSRLKGIETKLAIKRAQNKYLAISSYRNAERAWTNYRLQALQHLMIEKYLDNDSWSKQEEKYLLEIFPEQPWKASAK